MYKKVYEEIELENVDRGHCGEMRGKGSLRIPIIAKFQGVIYIGGFRMKECDFMVVDGESIKYDINLGYKFLKENQMVINPKRKILETRDGKGCIKFNLGNRGEEGSRRFYDIEVMAKANMKLEKGERTMVKVD